MATLLAKIIADFTTTLSTEIAVGGTSATLQSATDDDGVALPSGRYFFTLDGANSSKEHISCDLSGTSLTNIKTVSRQGTESSGVLRKHRIGASVTITDFAHILQINNLLNGTTDLNASTPLEYDGTATISSANQLATKDYVDGVAISGGADASTTVKGITKMSVAPASATSPIAVGDNDGRVPTQDENDALVGNNTDIAVGSGNKFVTQTGLQHNAEKYAADTSGSSTAYVVTLSPAPTSLTAGMIVYAKIVNANTTTTPTLNVNSLGAKTIVKGISTALVAGDIGANSFNTFIYDGTNFVLQNPIDLFQGMTASSTLRYSADTERPYNLITFAKQKEIVLRRYGSASVSFDIKNSTGSNTQQGQIYVNGSARGTIRTVTGSSYTTFTETISNLNPGDLVQLYISNGGSGNAVYCRNFRISYDITSIVDGVVNTD